jgi:virginiamycin B lyase
MPRRRIVMPTMTNQTRYAHGAKGSLAIAVLIVSAGCVGRHGGNPVVASTSATSSAPPSSSEWLALLPDGEEKRRFVLDCTGCHQLDRQNTQVNGRARTRDEWHAVVTRMLSYAGASTGFPVISAHRNADSTAAWLSRHLGDGRPPPPRRLAPAVEVRTGAVTEFMMPEARDLPHDVAVDRDGQVLITGMFTHRVYTLDPATGRMTDVAIPVDRANPRAIEIDAAGNWWLVLGGPNQLARYEPATKQWRTFDVGMYAHSVALSGDGRAWANGHFTRAPEIIASADPRSGTVQKYELPLHAAMGSTPGGPIPYEIRVAPNGRIWMSELQGNRLLALDPATGASTVHEMPTTFSGPRRFDIDAQGVLWIPAYTTNELVRYDPAARSFRRFALPLGDAVPYVARIDHGTGTVWIGTSAADAVLRFDPRRERFTVYELPSRGALVRHLSIDPRTHDVWLAYGASPGIPARVARLRP